MNSKFETADNQFERADNQFEGQIINLKGR